MNKRSVDFNFVFSQRTMLQNRQTIYKRRMHLLQFYKQINRDNLDGLMVESHRRNVCDGTCCKCMVAMLLILRQNIQFKNVYDFVIQQKKFKFLVEYKKCNLVISVLIHFLLYILPLKIYSVDPVANNTKNRRKQSGLQYSLIILSEILN